MALLVVKALLAPALLAACSFASWRWGTAVGGWLLGLPLISGPVSVLLFVEHGERFAETAARGTLLGLLATGAFCVWYAFLSRRARWWLTLPLAYGACLSVAWGLSFIHMPLTWLVAAVLTGLGVLAVLYRRPAPVHAGERSGVGALLLKMAAAGAVVVAITAGADVVGPTIAGLLAPLPVVLALMAASSHRREGYRAAAGLLSGALAGTWGGAAFFAVVVLALGALDPAFAYLVALAAALTAAAFALRVQQAELSSARLNDARRRVGAELVRERHLPRVRLALPAAVWMLRG